MMSPLFFKLLFASIMLTTSFAAGLAPLYIESFRKNILLSSIGNCFSAGIFVAVALVHLLPEGVEDIEDSIGSYIPLGYMMVLVGYTLILFIERIVFDHEEHSLFEEEKTEDIEEVEVNEENLLTNSLIINGLINEETTLIETEKQLEENKNTKEEIKSRDILITGIVLATALSVHSIFEGIVIGLENTSVEVINISLAIILHKIPASLALGNSLKFLVKWKAVIFISIFTVSSPLGILIGIGLESMDIPIMVGISLTVCAGTFLYIGCSELVIQEFGVEYYKKSKFVAFLVGICLFVCLNQLIKD